MFLARDTMRRTSFAGVALLLLAGALALWSRAADQPLTKDDVTLLLIGGATSEKLIPLIGSRGVAFQMTPDLAKKFHDLGASEAVIEALQKAGQKVTDVVSARAASANPAANPASPTPATLSAASTAPSAAQPKRTSGIDLSDPPSERIEQIVQEFAGKEKLFKQARDNYTYHQVNKVQQLDVDGNVVGVYQQEWDILYDDKGGRIERVTYAPLDTLRGLMVTAEDLESFRNIQPFVLTMDELPEYDVKYLGHVKVDELAAYVFSIRPKEIKKGRQYFQGTAWVDDRDLQIVKSEGKPVPELRTKKGENLFPRFTTYREQIDGKYWFPTFTMADDTLYFSSGPIHIKQVIKYTDYKQFKSTSRILSTSRVDEPSNPATQSPTKAPKK